MTFILLIVYLSESFLVLS